MRNLFIPGFLGSKDDLKPLANFDEENVFVDLKNLLSISNSFKELKQNFINKYGSGPFNKAVGYSFGGRILARLDLDVKTSFYISSNFLNIDEEKDQRISMAKEWLLKFETNLEETKKTWEDLPLFSSHKMLNYRQDLNLITQDWGIKEIRNYFLIFFRLEEMINFNESDFYIFGDRDEKYSRIALKLSGQLKIHKMVNAGHRCCYEHPVALKNFIQSVG